MKGGIIMSHTIVRRKAGAKRCGISDQTARRKGDPNSKYYDPTWPKLLELGPNSVGYVEEELNEWIAARIAERDAELLALRVAERTSEEAGLAGDGDRNGGQDQGADHGPEAE